MKSLGVAKKVFERISFACSVLSTGLIVVMMFAVVLDVIMRWLKTPIYGVYELQGVLVGMTIYLGLAKTQERKQHIGVSILGQYLPNRIVNLVSIPIYAVSMVFFCWLTYIYGGKAHEAYVMNEVIAGITKIPIFPLKMVMTLGLALLTLQLFIDLVKEIKALFSIQDDGPTDTTKNEKTEVPEL
ncbi:TRAP transporter small permease [Alkalihalobacillus sp. BA299]|uniref:TRAP transporter small permease n=1 Tax=Alkalihalobacillus sp. BA299 TaxID=2815938 RepID=UPI001ADA2546|nr:TRAP transporter small permease [Alkalihalobacillus sp. BA299]